MIEGTDPRHIVKALAKHGFRVRGTVRDEAKAEFLRRLVPGVEAVVVGEMGEVSSPLSYSKSVPKF